MLQEKLTGNRLRSSKFRVRHSLCAPKEHHLLRQGLLQAKFQAICSVAVNVRQALLVQCCYILFTQVWHADKLPITRVVQYMYVALERSQLSIARAITRLPRRRHSNEAVLAKIGWPTLAWRRRRYKLLLVWRLVNGEGPPSLSSFFSLPLSSRSHYSLRNLHSLPQVLCHSSHRLKDFLPSAIALWNRLPSCICF